MATPDQHRQRLLATYGACNTCGTPRDIRTTELERYGDLVQLEHTLVCTADDTHQQA